ncbi:hypothetical protein HK097_006120 [Rhizophlyctis rosea]|uniref:Uncharacterized protein n=1 Tax=Rhizophlyctis rosea TaxID=64517 RepID=A0AAD5SKU3_9FUNG|nr:hypothetical protein HK097_006120 [Rhizophlyctis rosea]
MPPRPIQYITTFLFLIVVYLIINNPSFASYQQQPPTHQPAQPEILHTAQYKQTILAAAPLAALRFLSRIYKPNSSSNGPREPKPISPYSLESIPNPWEAIELSRGARSFRRDEILQCVNELPSPHLVFLGDSTSRDLFNALMKRLSSPFSINATHPFDSQKGSIAISNTTFTFSFLRDIAMAPKRLDGCGNQIGGLIFNSGLWEQTNAVPQNTSYLIRYAKGISSFALHVKEKFGEDVGEGKGPRLIWRSTTPIDFSVLDAWRKTWMSNTKVRALNDIAGRILSVMGFEQIDLTSLFVPFWESKSNRREGWKAGFHLSERMNEVVLDVILDGLCGPKLGLEDLRVWSQLSRAEIGQNYYSKAP